MKPMNTVPDTARRALLAALPLLALHVLAFTAPAHAAGFDHSHAAWTALLKKHVVLRNGGNASALRYAGMQADRAQLEAYLNALAGVSEAEFAGFSRPQQMAYLINLYNARTVALILTRYPDLKSIRELGSLFESPWAKGFVPLFGQTVSLDHIEHERLRAPGVYDDPRVHFAVNCASIGCPSLREEAYVGDRLDAQLDQQAKRFLSDRSRNRWNAKTRTLEVSRIFDWYGEDFEQGHRGIRSLPAFFAGYAEQLADAQDARAAIRAGKVDIDFLDYDWALNDAR